MIANCKQARHGEEIGDYNEEKKVNGVYVATEIFRNNVFGIDAKECVKEMREAQEQSSALQHSAECRCLTTAGLPFSGRPRSSV